MLPRFIAGSKLRFKLTTLFKTLVDLQMMVQGIEEDLGLSDLGNIEKRVLLSIIEFHDKNGVASTAEILAHPLLTTFSRPSLFRALKLLEETGRILKVSDRRGFYAPAKNVGSSISEV
jgi:hypothetical protein